ncbi:MAG: phosphatidylglycerol lysyltransferase domain-containing protein [Elusimicrobiota bacterium]|jgi:phosphatidylglycerol lysyltransferase|nr:phosphatidylglycerol lysyltransferase domain-containing protein [Elusimicrobiota bacterium]
MKRYLKFIIAPLGLLIFVIAIILLHNQLKNLNYKDIANAFSSIASIKIYAALFLALFYYFLLGCYDVVAFRYVGQKNTMKFSDILLSCFISNALGNNTGYSMLFGGSIRYRLYSIHNISMLDVTKVLFFSSATIWLGLLVIGSFVFTFSPAQLDGVLNFNFSTKAIGIFFILILAVYLILCSLHFKKINLFNKTFSFPNLQIAFWQIFLSVSDWLIASVILYILMPSGEFTYLMLLKVFLAAQLLAIISQVPGGMGVFETTIALLLPSSASNPAVIGGLLAYRAIFYFFPLSIALLLLCAFEISQFIKKTKTSVKVFGKTLSALSVQFITILSFIYGTVLMFYSISPSTLSQSNLLQKTFHFVPWAWVFDFPRFLLSASAIALLFISKALQFRVKSARSAALFLMTFSIIVTFNYSFNILIFILFAFLFVLFILSKKYFYREKSIFAVSLNMWWFSTVCGVFALSLWVGFFINRYDVFYWIHISQFLSDIPLSVPASNFLKTALYFAFIILAVLIEQILKKITTREVKFSREDIKTIIYKCKYTYAFSALLKDKRYIVSDTKDAFIAFARSGDSLIALGDPIGNPERKPELIWRFKEFAEKTSAKPFFLGVDRKYLQIYNDVNLEAFTIGQEAKINLKSFNKDLGSIRKFSLLEKELEQDGFEYEILPPSDFDKYSTLFSNIDADWKQNTGYVEMDFIPSQYDPSYMKHFNFAVVKKDGIIIAFASFLTSAYNYEAMCCAVRYRRHEKDIFSYLIFKSVLAAREKNCKFFDLGFTCNQQGNGSTKDAIFETLTKTFMFAEHFNYDNNLLRKFKSEFQPLWCDIYIAILPDQYNYSFIEDFISLISPNKFEVRKNFLRRFFIEEKNNSK